MELSANTRAEVITRLRRSEADLRAPGIRRLALFGSFVRDQSHAGSDVDILVEFEPGEKDFDHFMALCALLEDVLQRPVDVVTTESLSPFTGPHILDEALDVLRAA